MSEGTIESKEKLPPLNEREVVKILWESFKFSQGTSELQKEMLQRINSYYKERPELDEYEIQERFSRMVINGPLTAYITEHKLTKNFSHPNVDSSTTDKELGRIYKYIALLTDPKNADLDDDSNFDLASIYNNIWTQDFSYLVEKNGRQNRLVENTGNNTLQDKYFSFGVHYLLRKNDTGNVAFNKLFNELRTIEMNLLNVDQRKQIEQVIKKYNETHPETCVKFPFTSPLPESE
jgi:hypothetical protein